MITLNDVPCYPIWQDIILSVEGTSISAVESADFEVVRGNKTLLSGTAVKRPGDAYISVRVNDVVSPWVRPRLALKPSSWTVWCDDDSADVNETGLMPMFQIVWRALDTAVSQNFYVFADWSFDRKRTYDFVRGEYNRMVAPSSVLSDLIDGIIDPRQIMMFSYLIGDVGTFNVGNGPGGGYSGIGATRGDPGSPTPGPATYYCRVSALNYGIYATPYFTLEAVREIWSDPTHFTRYKDSVITGLRLVSDVSDACPRYVLYYVNAYGGWDWFVIQGKTVESDTINRAEYTRRGRTAMQEGNVVERGRVVLQNQVTKHLELHTHFLTNDEASRMHHLLESQDVYVHDLETDIVTPAIITTTQAPVKTYKNEGHRLFSYQIDLDIATEFGRR